MRDGIFNRNAATAKTPQSTRQFYQHLGGWEAVQEIDSRKLIIMRAITNWLIKFAQAKSSAVASRSDPDD